MKFRLFLGCLAAGFSAGLVPLRSQTTPPGTAAHRPPFNLPPSTPEQRAAAEKAEVERLRTDWAGLKRYQEANAQVPEPSAQERRVVFIGDSITEGWGIRNHPIFGDLGPFFPGKPYLNRGIAGQTSSQMLVRFHQDVIDLKPQAVVILAGTNDIAENTGKTSLLAIENNLDSMCELAQVYRIRVVLGSVLPVKDYWWHRGLEPAPKIRALNAWIRDYAHRKRFGFIDYYSSMVDGDGDLKMELSKDGVHPNGAGYSIMSRLAEAGIEAAFQPSRLP